MNYKVAQIQFRKHTEHGIECTHSIALHSFGSAWQAYGVIGFGQIYVH